MASILCEACGCAITQPTGPWIFNYTSRGVPADQDVRGSYVCDMCYVPDIATGFTCAPLGLTAKIRARRAHRASMATASLPSIFYLTDIADLSATWTEYAVPGSEATLKARRSGGLCVVVEIWRNGAEDTALGNTVVNAVFGSGTADAIALLHACGRELQRLAPAPATTPLQRLAPAPVTAPCPSSWTFTVTMPRAHAPKRARAERNAIGHLCCSTVGCRSTSEYAEPAPDGSWTCGECRAVEGW